MVHPWITERKVDDVSQLKRWLSRSSECGLTRRWAQIPVKRSDDESVFCQPVWSSFTWAQENIIVEGILGPTSTSSKAKKTKKAGFLNMFNSYSNFEHHWVSNFARAACRGTKGAKKKRRRARRGRRTSLSSQDFVVSKFVRALSIRQELKVGKVSRGLMSTSEALDQV